MSYNSDNPLWNQSIQDLRNSIEQIGVKIVILGPARQSPGYQKRQQIKEHLQSLTQMYDVVFPEEFEVPRDLVPDQGRWRNIEFLVGEAELVFALLIDDRNVTGVLAEVTKYGDTKSFRNKAYLILPKKRKTSKGSFLPQIWVTAHDYPKEMKLLYSDEEFSDCSRIRDYVGSVADRLKKVLAWKKFLESKGMSTFPYS